MSVHSGYQVAANHKHRSAQRDRVLLAARRCFIRRGFHATGMDEISKACRMSVGNLYRYFPNKKAIVQAISDETRARIIPVLRRLENHQNPVDGVIDIILLGIRELCQGADARLWMEISAEAPRNRSIHGIYRRFDQEIRAVLTRLLERARTAGQLSRETDFEAVCVWLIALLDGAIARVSMDPAVDLKRILDTLARSMRRCLCSPAS